MYHLSQKKINMQLTVTRIKIIWSKYIQKHLEVLLIWTCLTTQNASTYSAVILHTIVPEATSRELPPDDDGAALDEGLTDAQDTACRVVQRQTVVYHIRLTHLEEIMQRISHVKKPANMKKKLSFNIHICLISSICQWLYIMFLHDYLLVCKISMVATLSLIIENQLFWHHNVKRTSSQWIFMKYTINHDHPFIY